MLISKQNLKNVSSEALSLMIKDCVKRINSNKQDYSYVKNQVDIIKACKSELADREGVTV